MCEVYETGEGVIVKGYSTMHKPKAGLDPPPVDDTSYEADTLPTKPPPLDCTLTLLLSNFHSLIL